MINLCVLSFILSIVAICRLFLSNRIQNEAVLWTFGAAMVSYLFYRWALVGVSHWGELVKSAFDCYLLELATQLGFELPETEERRRRFWTAFSLQITYGRNEDGKSPFNVHEWIKPQSTDVSAEHKGQKKPAATKIEKEKESEKNKSDDDDDEDDDG